MPLILFSLIVSPLFGQESDELTLLKKQKLYFLTGNFKNPEDFLSITFNNPQSRSFTIKSRYDSLNLFLLEKYNRSLTILEHDKFRKFITFKEICIQKLITMIMSSEMDNFIEEFHLCSYLNRNQSTNEHLWMKMFKMMALSDQTIPDKFINNFSTIETSAISMKMALQFGREQFIIDKVEHIYSAILERPEIKELLGLIYYRLNKTEEALKTIENVRSLNTENIRGNLALLKKDYDGAYKHFKSALSIRSDSLNSLHQIIPLSWILRRWQDGIKYIASLPENEGVPEKKGILNSLFYVQLQDFQKADQSLRQVRNIFRKKMRSNESFQRPDEITLMAGHLALMNKNNEDLVDHSLSICESFDGILCQLVLYQIFWKDLSKAIDRTNNIHKTSFDIEELKKKQEIVPLEEEIIIDQSQIEQLDLFF